MFEGPSFLVTFLYYFSLTSLIVSVLVSVEMGIAFPSIFPLRVGLAAGIFAGAIGTYINRSVSIAVSFPNQRKFSRDLESILSEMGFPEKYQVDDFMVYQQAGLFRNLGGKILVKIDQKSATIIGRSSRIKKMRQLGLENCI